MAARRAIRGTWTTRRVGRRAGPGRRWRRAITDGLPPGPFRGVPFVLKDLGAEARDYPSHNGSRLFANTAKSV